MKAFAIIFASVLLVGCQAVKRSTNEPNQYAQSLSSANQDEESGTANLQNNGLAQQHLWNFISDELRMPIPKHNRVQEQKNRYLATKGHIHDVMQRAEPYMYWIVDQIKKRNMPMELALLPIVESAFDPQATSSAKAAGLWQIVPQTGRNYGLKQTQWYDGRRDVAASTTTALDILQRLNRMFNGDWLLTLAAYNSGEGRVMQAIKANKQKGLATNYWALSLPRETALYVPKMLALSDVVKHYKRYGIKLPHPNSERALARVEVGQQVKLAKVADLAGIPFKTLKSFNSGYTRDITAPNGPHYIMLPKSHASQLEGALSNTQIAALRTEISGRSLNSPSSSTRRSAASYLYNDRRNSISTIARRVNIKPTSLQSLDSITTAKNSSNRIKTITRSAQNKPANSIRDSKQTKNASIKYRVRQGDSLYSIAKRHGVEINDVMRWNSVIAKDNRIQPGDTLRLYVANN